MFVCSDAIKTKAPNLDLLHPKLVTKIVAYFVTEITQQSSKNRPKVSEHDPQIVRKSLKMESGRHSGALLGSTLAQVRPKVRTLGSACGVLKALSEPLGGHVAIVRALGVPFSSLWGVSLRPLGTIFV